MTTTATETQGQSLPANAYTPLKPGETYTPIVSAVTTQPEMTLRAIFWGSVFCVIFSVASAYSALKVGQGMEAAIPISILAIGMARLFRRRSSLLENMIITGIGAASASTVAGAVFTVPALYSLHLAPHPVQTIFICLAGGCLGVLFLIPLRHYFVRETHGHFPFPEATAITEVLVTGEKGGSQARLLLQATAIAGVYDLLVSTFHVWKEYLNFQFIPLVRGLADRGRMVFNFDAIGFILGLGYVMGLRSAIVFCAGGIMANFILIPLIWFTGSHMDFAVYPGTMPISHMTAVDIYRNYVRFIGVGAIVTAGILGVIKSLRVIVSAFGIAMHTFRHGEAPQTERTDRDVSMVTILLGVVIGALAVAIFFGSLKVSFTVLAVGMVLTLVFAFFFTSVAANAIATTANNPASGMTMLTVIISCLVLLRFGLSGNTGMFFVMAIAGMVCTALCASGQFITDLKAGYWLGSTPAAQEKVKFLGVVACRCHGRAHHHPAGAHFPVRRSGCGRHAASSGCAAGIDHEGARGWIHEPAASNVSAVRHGRADHAGAGDAGTLLACFCAGYLPAAEPDYANSCRRHPLSPGKSARREDRRRARQHDSRARGDSCIGTDGGRRTGRRAGRGVAPYPQLPRRLDSNPVLLQRTHLAIRFCNPVYRRLRVCMAVVDEASEGGVMDQAGKYVADAVLGVDTLWGGDVMCPSGTGRFIADSWFSDEKLPAAYTHPSAERLRQSGGVSGKEADGEALDQYLRAVDMPGAIAGVRKEAASIGGLRGAYLDGLAICLETMWDLAMEVAGRGDPVPYKRAVKASTGKPPEPSQPRSQARARSGIARDAPVMPRMTKPVCLPQSMPGAKKG